MLTYRSSGVVNFAHGAMGMYVAFAFYELRQSGDLVLPVLGLPARLHVVDRPTVLTALAVCLPLAAALGLVVYALVFRPLRSAPPLAKVVASLGLLLYLQAVVDLRFTERGATVFEVTSMLPGGSVEVGDVIVFKDRFVLAGIVVAATLVLWLVFRATRFGLATRAAAESEKGAVLLGHSPDWLGAANWALASVLAGGAVILIAPLSGLDVTTTSLLVVPALAAALVGRLSDFVVTAAAGLAIGMAQSVALRFVAEADWLPDWVPRGGVQMGLPFLVIVLVMAVRGQALPSRGSVLQRRFPPSPPVHHAGLTIGGVAMAGTIGLLVLPSDWRLGLIVSMVAAVLALSVVVLTGFVGQISVAQMAIAGVAGFLTAKLTVEQGLAFPLSPLVAVAVAGIVGVLAGLPAVRVRGLNLAIATLAFSVAVEELVFKSSAFGGGLGGIDVPEPELFGTGLGIAGRGRDYPQRGFGFLVLVVLVLVCLLVTNLRRSPTGLRWLAVRANERAATAAGIDVRAAKLSAFAVSAVIAGVGGVLLGYQRTQLSVQSFVVLQSLAVLAFVYLAGITSVGGALLAGGLAVGGLLTVALEHVSDDTTEYQFAVTGLALMAAAVLNPEGLTGAARRLGRRLRLRVSE